MLLVKLDCFIAVAALSDYGHIGLVFKDEGESFADHRVIVNNDQPNGMGTNSAIRVTIRCHLVPSILEISSCHRFHCSEW